MKPEKYWMHVSIKKKKSDPRKSHEIKKENLLDKFYINNSETYRRQPDENVEKSEKKINLKLKK